MADTVAPDLRHELMAAQEVLEPQLRGLADLTRVSISDPLLTEVRSQYAYRQHRWNLIQNVLVALDAVDAAMAALENDGYPALTDEELGPATFAELEGQNADLDSAIAIFIIERPASNVAVNLGAPAPKPEGA